MCVRVLIVMMQINSTTKKYKPKKKTKQSTSIIDFYFRRRRITQIWGDRMKCTTSTYKILLCENRNTTKSYLVIPGRENAPRPTRQATKNCLSNFFCGGSSQLNIVATLYQILLRQCGTKSKNEHITDASQELKYLLSCTYQWSTWS